MYFNGHLTSCSTPLCWRGQACVPCSQLLMFFVSFLKMIRITIFPPPAVRMRLVVASDHCHRFYALLLNIPRTRLLAPWGASRAACESFMGRWGNRLVVPGRLLACPRGPPVARRGGGLNTLIQFHGRRTPPRTPPLPVSSPAAIFKPPGVENCRKRVFKIDLRLRVLVLKHQVKLMVIDVPPMGNKTSVFEALRCEIIQHTFPDISVTSFRSSHAVFPCFQHCTGHQALFLILNTELFTPPLPTSTQLFWNNYQY